jgi:hypothetical protein
VQKYFPESGPVASSESGLELFEARPPEPEPITTLEPIESNSHAEPLNDLEPLASPAIESVSAAEFMPAPVIASSETLEDAGDQAADLPGAGFTLPEADSAFSEEPLPEEESEQHRGFFSRLLRR